MVKGNKVGMYVGQDSTAYGGNMIGSIKQIQFISRNLNTHQLIKNAAFTYLFKETEPDLLFQVTLFNTTSGLVETVSKVQAQLKGNRNGVTPQIDFKS